MLPAGMRQRDQTKKSPTGPYDRDALMQHLEKVALEHKDREDLVPFTGEKKGGRTGQTVLTTADLIPIFPQEKPSWRRNQPRFRNTSR